MSSAAIADGAGKRCVSAPCGSGSGSPCAATRRPEHRPRGLHRDLLSGDGAHGDLPRVDGPRDAQAGPRAHRLADHRVLAELRGDRRGVGVEVEQAPAARDGGGQVAQVVQAQLAAHAAALGRQRDGRSAVLERQHAPIGPPVELLQAADRSRAEERDQPLAVERLSRGEPQRDDPGPARRTARTGAAAQLGRRARVDGAHRVVELPHAAESRAERDLREREIRRLDERARRLRAMGAGERQRAGADLRDEDPVQVALGVAELPREAADAVAIDDAVGDEPERAARDVRAPIPGGRSRSGVRIAALAGAKALRLRCGHGGEQPHVRALGRARRAARAAVDPGRAHGDEEVPVVARIAALHEAVAALEVLDHVVMVARPRRCGWRKSDTLVANADAVRFPPDAIRPEA